MSTSQKPLEGTANQQAFTTWVLSYSTVHTPTYLPQHLLPSYRKCPSPRRGFRLIFQHPPRPTKPRSTLPYHPFPPLPHIMDILLLPPPPDFPPHNRRLLGLRI
jgi:hypothetical protein